MEGKYSKEASELCKALRELCSNENSIDNFECYLSHHFQTWLDRFANSPEDITEEIKEFASIK